VLEFFIYGAFGTLPLAMTALVGRFVCFDRLIRILFSERHAEWDKLGRPPGFFWFPKGASIWGGAFQRGQLCSDWFAEMPDWISENEDRLRKYRQFRLAGKVSRILLGFFLVNFFVVFIWLLAGASFGR
jgi:hypothetical protein